LLIEPKEPQKEEIINHPMDTLETTPKPPPPQPEQPRTPRIAVFGGSFDPVHSGHLLVAGAILRQNLADEVLFVPAKRPPHKLDRILSPAKHRLAMLEAAITEYPQFSMSDIELQREDGPSYTIDTLETLKRIYNDSELIFVMCMDSLAEIHTWYRATELVNRHEFLVYPRPGVEPPTRLHLNNQFGAHNAAKLLNCIIRTTGIAVSSTDIRQAASTGRCLAGLVPAAVARYIEDNRLYRIS
jgi:nicotinate-nucleotide adenylyltransferase